MTEPNSTADHASAYHNPNDTNEYADEYYDENGEYNEEYNEEYHDTGDYNENDQYDENGEYIAGDDNGNYNDGYNGDYNENADNVIDNGEYADGYTEDYAAADTANYDPNHENDNAEYNEEYNDGYTDANAAEYNNEYNTDGTTDYNDNYNDNYNDQYNDNYDGATNESYNVIPQSDPSPATMIELTTINDKTAIPIVPAIIPPITISYDDTSSETQSQPSIPPTSSIPIASPTVTQSSDDTQESSSNTFSKGQEEIIGTRVSFKTTFEDLEKEHEDGTEVMGTTVAVRRVLQPEIHAETVVAMNTTKRMSLGDLVASLPGESISRRITKNGGPLRFAPRTLFFFTHSNRIRQMCIKITDDDRFEYTMCGMYCNDCCYSRRFCLVIH